MWLILLILLCSNVYAQSVVTITQYGYITDNNGHIIGKYDNDINTGKSVNLPNGYTYTSVPDESSLQSIQIYKSPVDAFSVDKFVSDLLGSFGSDVNVLPYYAAFKDMAFYKNFSGMKYMVTGLLTAGKLTQQEVDILNSVLANQGIVLSSF